MGAPRAAALRSSSLEKKGRKKKDGMSFDHFLHLKSLK
jgi:hypothetical protein